MSDEFPKRKQKKTTTLKKPVVEKEEAPTKPRVTAGKYTKQQGNSGVSSKTFGG